MGAIVNVAYRPKPGKQPLVMELTKEHFAILRAGSGYRTTITCEQAGYGTVIKVFEWESQEAIAAAHTNPVVQKMWEKSEEK